MLTKMGICEALFFTTISAVLNMDQVLLEQGAEFLSMGPPL
jgi:hypothetical protein